jgi:hypothetical protein
MERDPLEQLLRRTDRQAGKPPALAGNLAQRVRRSHRKRLIVARTASAITICLILLGVMVQKLRPGVGDVSQSPFVQSVPPTDRRLDELKTQADQLYLELANLGSDNQAIATDEASAERASEEARDQQLERAASLFVYQGDRYYRELGMHGQAEASYRQIVNHFPNTYAAQAARSRLTELENEKGNRS